VAGNVLEATAEFQADTGISSPFTQDFTISGLGFTPVAAVIEAGNATALNTFTDDIVYSQCLTDGTRHRCGAIFTEHGAATSNTGRSGCRATMVFCQGLSLA